MRLFRHSLVLALTGLAAAAQAQPADVRAKADVSCTPTAKALVFDCTIRLADLKSGEALSGVEVTLSADMPSMPMAHNVRPVKGEAAGEPGLYRALIELEMHGDWALKIDLSGKVRDRVVKSMRFEPAR